MKTALTCAQVREQIAAHRGGWLPVEVARKVEQHVEGCSDCAREVRRDAALCLALGALPAEQAPPAAFVAPGARTPRPALPAGRLTIAAAAALSGLALLLIAHPGGVRNPAVGPAPPRPAGLPSASASPALWAEAHDLVSLSDCSADPNRLVVLLHAGRAQRAQQ